MQRCMPRILPPWTWRAMGSMDLRSSALHWPTMEWKKGSRGSLRAKHPRHWSWNAWSSSRNPSTSRGVRSNCGMENTSPSVRCAGNIFCLLVLICAFGGSVDRENQPVKYRCRCRVIEPTENEARRIRRTAYRVSLRSDSARAECTYASMTWLVQSKGIREETWQTTPADDTYSPSTLD